MDAKKGKNTALKDARKLICTELSGAVKRLQEMYIRTKQIKSGNGSAELLCDVVEAIFLHELKNSRGQIWREVKRPNPNIPPDPSFWAFIEPMVSDDIKMQLQALRNSESDVRKCRSWVRLVLVKGLILSFMYDLQRHPGLLACHYGGEAVLRHMESSEFIIGLLNGLSVIQLEYDYANPRLDTWDPSALHLAGLWTPPKTISAVRKGSTASNTPSRSPAHGGRSVPPSSTQRISPPASDFDVEGVSIINLALDKYTQKKARTEQYTDNQLIVKELTQQTPPANSLKPPTDNQDAQKGDRLSVFDAEASTRSYGAMLRSYARKNSSTISDNLPPCDEEDVLNGSVANEGERQEGKKDGSFAMALSMNYEIVTPEGAIVEPVKAEHHQQHQQIMKDHLTVLVNEQGLDSQNYHCVGCNRPVGLIFGQSRLCRYNGQHYCSDCHHDDERVIPARMLFNWDFRKHKVCIASGEYLDRIQHTRLIDVEDVNQALYLYIPEMEEARKLRRQCNLLKGYLLTCKDPDTGVQFKKRLRSSYVFEHIHKYSIQDLIDVHSGAFNDRLKKTVKMGIKHIRQCMLCSQRGFICEVCHSDEVIYPFDVDHTYQCANCNALFHHECKPAKGNCPKCFRMRKRRANSLNSEEDTILTTGNHNL